MANRRRKCRSAPPIRRSNGWAEQLADFFAENRINVRQRSDPAAELEAACRVLFRPAGGLHHAVHRNERADNHFSHASLLFRAGTSGLPLTK